MNISVISFEMFKEKAGLYDLVIALNEMNKQQVIDQLQQEQIFDYEIIDI